MQIEREQIYKTLRFINRRFDAISGKRDASVGLESELLSKLAVIELGGWIEDSIDNILTKYVNKKIKAASERKHIREDIIEKVYGFDYKKNVRPLLERILGVRNYHRLVLALKKKGDYCILTSDIASLVGARNIAAHTHTKGVSRSFDAPSKTLDRFKRLYPVVQKLQKMVAAL